MCDCTLLLLLLLLPHAVKLYSPLLKIEEVETASSFNITCSQYGYARNATEVLFHKDGLQLGSDQDSRFEVITDSETQGGEGVNISTILRVHNVKLNDSGNYTCSLQGAGEVNVTVDVLAGEYMCCCHGTRLL